MISGSIAGRSSALTTVMRGFGMPLGIGFHVRFRGERFERAGSSVFQSPRDLDGDFFGSPAINVTRRDEDVIASARNEFLGTLRLEVEGDGERVHATPLLFELDGPGRLVAAV